MISTLVPPMDQPSQIETKSTTDVVKFGWIIGVFVCSIKIDVWIREKQTFSVFVLN